MTEGVVLLFGLPERHSLKCKAVFRRYHRRCLEWVLSKAVARIFVS